MTNHIKAITAIGIIILLNACKGQDGIIGSVGASGATGAIGATGAKGTAGTNGNSNIVYTDWKSVSTDVRYSNKNVNGDYVEIGFFPKDKSEPLFTKDAISKAMIITYMKCNSLELNNGIYDLPVRIKQVQDGSRTNLANLLIPERRVISPINTLSLFLFSNNLYGENLFDYSVVIQPMTTSDRVQRMIPEFVGKDLKYFQDLVTANLQIRHVVVYGIVKGRYANLDWNDYEAVKVALNLKD